MPKDRLPPQDIDSERAVLGACMLDPEAALLVTQAVSASDFYRLPHQLIFKAIIDITTDGGTPDTAAVRLKLQETGDLQKVGGMTYLMGLDGEVPSAANAELYAKTVRDMAERRALVDASIKAYNMARRMEVPIEEIKAKLEEVLRKQEEGNKVSLSTAEVLSMAEDEASFNTGLRVIDECGGGVMCGMNMLCGGPGAGKSTLALQIIKEALLAGYPAYIMGRDQKLSGQAKFMWSNYTQTPVSKLNEFSDSYFEVEKWPLEWYKGRFDLASIASRIRLEAAKGVRWFMVDYLGLIEHPERGLKPHERKCVIAESLASLSHELSLYLLLISRSTKVGDGETPELRHVEGEAGVGNAADQVWYLQKDKDDPTHIKIGFLKSRQAYTGWEELKFDGPTHSFSDWSHIPDNRPDWAKNPHE